MFEHIANEFQLTAHRLRGQGRVIIIVWIPWYVGITFNEDADDIVEEAAG